MGAHCISSDDRGLVVIAPQSTRASSKPTTSDSAPHGRPIPPPSKKSCSRCCRLRRGPRRYLSRLSSYTQWIGRRGNSVNKTARRGNSWKRMGGESKTRCSFAEPQTATLWARGSKTICRGFRIGILGATEALRRRRSKRSKAGDRGRPRPIKAEHTKENISLLLREGKHSRRDEETGPFAPPLHPARPAAASARLRLQQTPTGTVTCSWPRLLLLLLVFVPLHLLLHVPALPLPPPAPEYRSTVSR